MDTFGYELFMDTRFITNVRFEKGSHMRKLESFRNCSIREVLDVPVSVEVIGWGCFEEAQLERITFEEGSRLRVLEDSCFRDVLLNQSSVQIQLRRLKIVSLLRIWISHSLES